MLQLHYYCPECNSYIGKNRSQEYCSRCKGNESNQCPDGRTNFFVYIPIEPQIKSLLSNTNLYQILTKPDMETMLNEEVIHDITSACLYRELVLNGQFGGNDLSLLWNTDGIPVFNSSNYSIWPLQATINELPPHLRKSNVLLLGLWWFSSPPCTNTFLRPFVTECRKLEEIGFHLSSEENPRKVYT